MKRITVIIPALNEEISIGGTIAAIPSSQFKKLGYEVEILVVDNGSKDKTAETAKNSGAKVVLEPKRGYGRAYKTGFSQASGDIIVTADADLTYPVEKIPELLRIFETEKLDFLTTNRLGLSNRSMRTLNRLGNNLLSFLLRSLYHIDIADSQSGMWMFKKSILDNIILKSDGMPLSEELKIEACYYLNCRWKEVPIEYRTRVGRVKLCRYKDGFRNLWHIIEKKIHR